jgi:hypothetical protein
MYRFVLLLFLIVRLSPSFGQGSKVQQAVSIDGFWTLQSITTRYYDRDDSMLEVIDHPNNGFLPANIRVTEIEFQIISNTCTPSAILWRYARRGSTLTTAVGPISFPTDNKMIVTSYRIAVAQNDLQYGLGHTYDITFSFTR